MKPKGKGLVDLSRWPAEPAAPATVDAARLAEVLPVLCGWMGPKRRQRFATWFVEQGAAHGIDPFLLAAVVYRSSRCLPRYDADFGVGLGGIHPRMHRGHVKQRRYHYHVLVGGKWVERTQPLASALYPGALKRQSKNVANTAALLAVAKAQCPANDGAFGSVPHRHFVSHYVWGDQVRGAGAEDRILRARRRLLAYYLDAPPPQNPKAVWRGSEANPGPPIQLTSPLDAPPRKVFSGLGKPRANGTRKHKGIDFDSTGGEPVRAVAAGKVLFAGVDWPRGKASEQLPFEEARTLKRSKMGPGGLFVMIHHGDTRISAYMHLTSYRVQRGDRVEAGQQIGAVGRSGVRSSGAHLHFEMRQDGKHIDPLPVLAPYVFRPDATWYGRWDAALPQRKRRRRAKESP